MIQGATVETPEGKQIRASDRGAGSINLRHVPHAGSKVVGDTAPKLATVHVVDKGTLLYDAPPNNSTSCVASEIQSPQQKEADPNSRARAAASGKYFHWRASEFPLRLAPVCRLRVNANRRRGTCPTTSS